MSYASGTEVRNEHNRELLGWLDDRYSSSSIWPGHYEWLHPATISEGLLTPKRYQRHRLVRSPNHGDRWEAHPASYAALMRHPGFTPTVAFEIFCNHELGECNEAYECARWAAYRDRSRAVLCETSASQSKGATSGSGGSCPHTVLVTGGA